MLDWGPEKLPRGEKRTICRLQGGEGRVELSFGVPEHGAAFWELLLDPGGMHMRMWEGWAALPPFAVAVSVMLRV